MSDIVQGLTLPVILSVAGIFLFLLGLASKVQLKLITVNLPSRAQRALSAGGGVILVLAGILVYVLPALAPAAPAIPAQTPAGANTASPAELASDTPSPTSTPTSTSTFTSTPTPSPSATQSLTATPEPGAIATPSPTSIPAWKTNISDGDRVAQTVTLIAEYGGDLAGDLWVFVVGPNGRWYPQSMNAREGAATPHLDGRWEMRVGLGEADEDEGDLYDIVLAVARTPLDSQFISNTLIAWTSKGEYPGFEAMPQEVSEVYRIRNVVRTRDRWGPAPDPSQARLAGQVEFTSISSGSLVTESLTLMGEYRNTADDIWVLVYPGHGRWYPQSTFPCTGVHTQQQDGRWQVPAKFGEDEPKTFDVVAILATEEASEFFDVRQAMWCRAGHFPGLLTIELPEGIDEKSRIRVYRQ